MRLTAIGGLTTSLATELAKLWYCAGTRPFCTLAANPLRYRRKHSSTRRFAQFIAVCSASILAEKLRMSWLLSSWSLENKGASSRPARASIYQLQPTTNSDKLSDVGNTLR